MVFFFWSDENVSFYDFKLSNDLNFDISNEPITHIMIPKTFYVDRKLHIVQDIIDRCYWIITSTGKKVHMKQQLKIYLIMMSGLLHMCSMRLKQY